VFKQQPITAVETEHQSGHEAPKQPPIRVANFRPSFLGQRAMTRDFRPT